MSNLFNFFSSFDKLMKEKLVKAFYWLVLLNIVLVFLGILFDSIGLDILDDVLDFFEFFILFVTMIVGLRLACELAIALFRINDNLSPDGGKSETANIDPLEEARKAAEAAAIRAREATKSTFERTKAATNTAVEKTQHAVDKTRANFADDHSAPEPGPNPARTPSSSTSQIGSTLYKKTAPKKTAATSKTATKKASTVKKKAAAKKPAPKKKAPTRKRTSGSVKYNKDGSIKKKPGPKPGSSSKYTKDGRLKKKPGPKPK